ncbi:MAG: hypothetical protein HZC47_00840 [Methanobacterium sp.]|uniref:hypothetical protein n=1 Tax=Methanobacterium sp. TaxID=2164 RepID=UPI003D652C56|nr:hypothetical protein [Methanobacterium sp.]
MPKENKSGALGRGLDALISKKYVKESENKDASKDNHQLNEKIVEDILADVKKNPRISLWSAKSAAVLRFLRKTEPEFSISSEASLLIEEAVKEKYPEIWVVFEDKV